MKTAAIPYRVADFLKQHPPFEFVEEPDLIALAARGRVKFHEPDEYLCWQGDTFGLHVLVIQQGAVQLWDETVDPPALRDIRGPGDVIGIERYNGAAASLYSAKSASEVVVYALEAAGFAAMLEKCPRAAQYVASHATATAGYEAAGGRPQAHEVAAAEAAGGGAACGEATTIREAAALLAESGASVLAVRREGAADAYLTAEDFLAWIASGASNTEAAAHTIARRQAAAVGAETPVSECLLAMAEGRARAAVVTEGGARGVVTAESLAAVFGDHPLAILDEIDRVRGVSYERGTGRLRRLHERARRWMLENLTAGALDWLARYGEVVNRRMLERLAELTGNGGPELTWCFAGSAGRQELLTAEAPLVAVIGGQAEGLAEGLAEIGYLAPEPVEGGSLEEWKERFSEWIRNPIGTQYYRFRALFDLRPVAGPAGPFEELAAQARRDVEAEPMFLHLLANDCLETLPPLTFFRDLVIENSGAESETFRLEKGAVQPLADVARVFSFACGAPLGASTRDRYELAGRRLPKHEAVLREAGETMRVALYHQARAGLRTGTNGAEIPLPLLSRHDRQGLKSGFRAIHRLLEFTAQGEWMEEL